jgi:hypothetical protein
MSSGSSRTDTDWKVPTVSRPPVPLRRSSSSRARTSTRGERGASRAAGPVEHRGADGPLEAGDLLAHRGLAEAEHRGGVGEGALLRDSAQRGEVADLEVAQRCAHGHIVS